MIVLKYNVERPTKKEINLLEKVFRIYEDIENAMLGDAKGNLMTFLQSKDFAEINPMKEGTERTKAFKALEKKHNLDSSHYDDLASKYLEVYKKNADSDSLQELGKRVKQSIDKYRFGNGKKIHFRKRGTLETIKSKQFDRCMYFNPCDMTFDWNQISLKLSIRKGDTYMESAHKQLVDDYENVFIPYSLDKSRTNIVNKKRSKMGIETKEAPKRPKFKIRFATLVRKKINNKMKYYVYVTVEDVVTYKFDKKTGELKNKPLDKEFGTDIGTSTVAIVNEDCDNFFEELASNIDYKEREIKELQKKLDHKKRINNPDNYNADGTLKKGKRKWEWSNSMRKIRSEISNLQRIVAAQKHDRINFQCNQVISTLGIKGKIEAMKFKNLQKRSKETKINPKTNRPYSKKRYGKSINHHCPATFVNVLRRKCEASGGELVEVDTYKLKLSQYNHFSNSFAKKELKDRYNEFNFFKLPLKLQRDLYSAFLALNVDIKENVVSVEKCNKLFLKFLIKHDSKLRELKELKNQGVYFPSCMGL